MKKIGLVVPCYNEEPSIRLFYKTVEKVFKQMKAHGMHYDYEYLFINDGSSDKTLPIIRDLHAKDPQHVHYISFARNFGKEAAMAAGFNNITGDYVAEMDVDLQDPPSLLPKMLKYIRDDGYDCVGCVQTSRKQGPIRAFLSKHFYGILNRISSVKIQPNVRDFRLMTRQFLNTFLKLKERNRFTKGLFSWVGFKVKFLKYKGRPRAAGKSDWSLHSLFEYSLEAIIDFSDVPLKIATIIGGFSCFLAFLGLIFVVLRAIFWGGAVAGWPSLVSIILLIGGIQLFCLGIIGKYIGKIYLEVKHRPLYTIKEMK
ncbi:glycosyltransferase family 2 protein [Acetilactobacillus jinshanensis]|uniref:Glycosyltransferase n=1 Tax=Acetilactobacillus jinshanensis TaxID=1720083 RepID=A0A4V1ALK0_9LACO|nr:glycosyltransferase family 2 protein [Acetilactobacillus jinshanensis]QBP17869.1 glycosyltransferase [Acetilactobacillus jinshanensis]URL60730.1 glycosyltransferase family 2 protein [uncultured bacterium]